MPYVSVNRPSWVTSGINVTNPRLKTSTASFQETVWVKDRGYTGFNTGQATATYSTPWFVLADLGSNAYSDKKMRSASFAATYRLTDLIVSGKEKGQGTVTAKAYSEWDNTPVADFGSVATTHPEESLDIAYWGPAAWGSSVYRTSRFYQNRVAADNMATGVMRVEFTTDDAFSMFGIDAYGTIVAAPAGRAPEGE